MVPPGKTGGDLMSYREERRSHWRCLVDKHAESGMSAVAFCRERGINPQQFYSWRRRFHGESPRPGFIRLVPTTRSSQSGIRIVLDHRISVELDKGFDPLTLREAVDALSNRGE
jgi:Transposase